MLFFAENFKTIKTISRISVIRSVCNLEVFLKETIDSILYKTVTFFEFFSLDDGATDKIQKLYNFTTTRAYITLNVSTILLIL